MKADIYQNITDQVVSELEKGVRPRLKPWAPDMIFRFTLGNRLARSQLTR